MKFHFEEHHRGGKILLVVMATDGKGITQIRGSFEVNDEEEAVKWQKAMEHVNSTLQSS